MLIQLIYILALLYIHLLLLILLNYLGLYEEINVLISTWVFAVFACSLSILSKFTFVLSCLFLTGLTLLLEYYELLPYLIVSMLGGYLMGVYLQDIEKLSERNAAKLFYLFNRSHVSYPQRFKPQRQKNSDHA